MSGKPPKKSDLHKPWMPKRRDRKIVIAPEYHLIVTEGAKTEPNYFEGLKRNIDKLYPGKIHICGTGRNTLSLLKFAEKVVNDSTVEFHHVWVVFDHDDFPRDNFDNTVKRCSALSNEDITYHALWSNECIELWFLLHFEFLQSALHRAAYYPKLSEHLNQKYAKNQDCIYEILKPRLNIAVKNAKSLLNSYNNFPPSKCNPATNIFEIFELLKPYID